VAIPLDRVDEVLFPQVFTRIPGTGPEVCGLIGLRGRVLTVFDLCALLGGPGTDVARDHRILVVRAAGRVVGLAVPGVTTGGGGEPEATAGPPALELELDSLIGSRLA
jgi:chemotaxis signal transduction protein